MPEIINYILMVLLYILIPLTFIVLLYFFIKAKDYYQIKRYTKKNNLAFYTLSKGIIDRKKRKAIRTIYVFYDMKIKNKDKEMLSLAKKTVENFFVKGVKMDYLSRTLADVLDRYFSGKKRPILELIEAALKYNEKRTFKTWDDLYRVIEQVDAKYYEIIMGILVSEITKEYKVLAYRMGYLEKLSEILIDYDRFYDLGYRFIAEASNLDDLEGRKFIFSKAERNANYILENITILPIDSKQVFTFLTILYQSKLEKIEANQYKGPIIFTKRDEVLALLKDRK